MTDDLDGLADRLRPFLTFADTCIEAPHVALYDWHGEATRHGTSRAHLANLIDAKERAFAKLAWRMRDHKDYVARHTLRFRLKALVECFERCSATLFDQGSRLTDDLGPAARLAWVNETGRFGLRGEIEEEERRIWAWTLQTLQANDQTMTAPADREALAGMPELVRLFRGFASPADASPTSLEAMACAPSWTADRDVAALYACRAAPLMGENPARFIASATVPKEAVIAYFPDYFEFVVANPGAFQNLKIERLALGPASDDLAG